MPSLPSAGLLAFRRTEGAAEVLLTRPRASGRRIWQVPGWEPDAGEEPVVATIEERLRQPRSRKPTRAQLLTLACARFATSFGCEAAAPFLFLGGVKQHRHRILYVWATELDCDLAAPALSGSGAVAMAHYLDLADARRLIVSSQRRFVDELEVLLRHQR